MSDIRVRVVIDARKARPDVVRKLFDLAAECAGHSLCIVELHTSLGIKTVVLGQRVEPSEAFYHQVRRLGWTAVPERVED